MYHHTPDQAIMQGWGRYIHSHLVVYDYWVLFGVNWTFSHTWGPRYQPASLRAPGIIVCQRINPTLIVYSPHMNISQDECLVHIPAPYDIWVNFYQCAPKRSTAGVGTGVHQFTSQHKVY